MKIIYFVYVSFLIEIKLGIKILIDLYDNLVGYIVFELFLDVVLIFYKYFDYGYIGNFRGDYVFVDKEGEFEVKGVKIKGIKIFYDKENG